MRIADHLTSTGISVSLAATDKDGVLREMAALAASTPGAAGLSGDAIYAAFRDRERLATTGVGSGVAIPHGRFPIEDIALAVGLSRVGVPFDAIDGAPVHVLVAVVAPESNPAAQLRVLARIARIMRSDTFRSELLQLPGPEEVLQALALAD